MIILSIFLTITSGVGAQGLIVREPIRFLALGDSYTIGQSVSESERWPVQLIAELSGMGLATEPARIIARTGWRTDNLKRAIEIQAPPKDNNLVSLLIGVNDFYQGLDTLWYRPAFEELLLIAVELAGGNTESVFVLSIPDYAYTPFGQSFNPAAISAGIDAFNAVNKSITDFYDIEYINITEISRKGLDQPGLVAGDGLHPSGLMYREWVARIMERIQAGNPLSNEDRYESNPTVLAYPNPAGEYIFLAIPEGMGENPVIRIYNASGRLINLTGERNHLTFKFRTSGLSPGVYFYTVKTENGFSNSGKFVVN
jgi:lysophospholipase L1-like esterase